VEVRVVLVEVPVVRRLFFSVLIVLVALVVGCGSSDSSNSVPQATNPNNVGTIPIPTPTTTSNGVPDLSHSAAIQVPNTNDYSGFGTLLEEQIYPPVVGNPEIQISAVVSRQAPYTASSNCTALIGIEDNYGWTGAEWSVYPDASTVLSDNTGVHANLYFSDTDTTVWVAGNIDSSGNWNGTIMYRMRAPGETQCEPVTCSPAGSTYCNGWIAQQAQYCVNYMNINTYPSQVKVLGYFQHAFSDWVTIQ